MTAGDALLAALADVGVTHLFGNPGSTELPLISALARQQRVEYVLGLHEAAVVGMADGWAQATGRMAAVNLHVAPGLLNGLSGMYNAGRARVPMLVSVGQQHTALGDRDPLLGGDLVAMADPVVKRAVQVDAAADLPAQLAQLVTQARTPPQGPVMLSLPVDVQSAPVTPVVWGEGGRVAPPPVSVATPEAVRRAVDLVGAAARPAIVAGDGLAWGDGPAALRQLAERLGAPVWGEPHAGRAPLEWTHPQWCGYLPALACDIRRALAPYDLVLAIGGPVFRVFGPSDGPLLPTSARLIHVDCDPANLGRNVIPDLGEVADPARFAADLAGRLAPCAPREQTGRDTPDPGPDPLKICQAIATVARSADMVVDEGLTSTRVLRRLRIDRGPHNWLAHRGSALGWGIPAAVGVAVAQPERTVWVVQGDGGFVFGAAALWTAARRRSRVRVVVADNGGYEILRRQMPPDDAAAAPWALALPGLDVATVARGYGVTQVETSTPDDVAQALARVADHPGPTVTVVRPTARPHGGGNRTP